MTVPPRLVLDTNVVISGFLWMGKPGQLLAMAGESEARLFSSRILMNEVQATLNKPRLMKALAATGLTGVQIMAEYRKLITIVRPATLESGISRDPDDDHILACAIAARADRIVTGDEDLLVLESFGGIAIRSVAALLVELA